MRQSTIIKSAWIFIALYIALGLTRNNASGQTDWSETQILFDVRPGWRNIGPSLVADEYGYAHLAWSHEPEEGGTTRLIFYSQWDGTGWTEPVDIFVSTGWPVLVPDDNGKVHIFWYANRSINHSWAWIEQARSVWSWAEPNEIVTCDDGVGCSTIIDVKRDKAGVFHVAYTYREGDGYYMRSEDEGETWSQPQPFSTTIPGVTTYDVSIAVGDDGRIHVTWVEIQLPESDYLRLNYAHSTDNGLTWSTPFEVGVGNQANGNMLTIGDSEVHLAWNGGVGVGGRYYMRSNDGGITWSEPVRISSQSGRAGYPSIVQDSSGNLHIMIAQGEHVAQVNGQWLPPKELPFFSDRGEQARFTILNGNQLLAVIPHNFTSIRYSLKNLDTPRIPPQDYPAVLPIAAPTIEPTPVVTAVTPLLLDESVGNPDFGAQSPPPTGQSPYSSLLVAFVVALLVSTIGIAIQYTRKIR